MRIAMYGQFGVLIQNKARSPGGAAPCSPEVKKASG
jgi:hypothetical protein